MCEIGEGRNAGRLRIKWSYSLCRPDGAKRVDTKRTWIKAAKPVSFEWPAL